MIYPVSFGDWDKNGDLYYNNKSAFGCWLDYYYINTR